MPIDTPSTTDGRIALEHADTPADEAFGQRVLEVTLVIVVAEHGDDGRVRTEQLADDHFDLGERAAPREITGEQQHVGVRADTARVGRERATRVGAEMEIADCRDADHRSCSSSGTAPTMTTSSPSRTTHSPHARRTISSAASRRASVATCPRTHTSSSPISISRPSSLTRGSAASA
jgi:hypothetical protein